MFINSDNEQIIEMRFQWIGEWLVREKQSNIYVML